MGKKELNSLIFKITEGVLSTTLDLTLWFIAFSTEMMVPQRSYGAAFRASFAADRFLEKTNYETIKRTLAKARRNGLIKKPGRGKRVNPEITEAGRKRLESILPFYDEKRAWDGKLYLITYDIPEKQRSDRQILREYLKKIGCGMLQQSVWITPYNPRETLREFIQERHLKGAVIVSDIGKDGSVGEEDINELVYEIYQLDALNERYQEFLQKFNTKEDANSAQIAFAFMSILVDDSQLPFALLPDDWFGQEAYQLFKKETKYHPI